MRKPLPTLLMGLTGLLVAVPSPAWAQDAEERIDGALAQAEEAGLPTSLLESKVAEGRAKGIPMDRIATAVEQRLAGLSRAQEVMGRGATDLDEAQLAVGADALGSGVSESVLQEIAATTPRERRAVAIAALAHLVEQDMASEQALEQVQAALGRGSAGLGDLPGVAGPPASLHIPGMQGEVGPPSGVPGPGQGGPPEDRPPRGGPPGGG